MKISILGEGPFGKAISTHLRRIGHTTYYKVHQESKILIVATPSASVVPSLKKVKDQVNDKNIVICSKGFADDGALLSDALRKDFHHNVFFLYGPTLADGLSRGDLSSMVLAGNGRKSSIIKALSSGSLRIETSTDIVGVQVGAALKNVVTIFVGVAEGAGYSGNTQAYVFTRGLQEIQKIGVALGARPQTFMGLSCVGDLTLHSRNRYLGIEFGKGRALAEIIAETGYSPEGITALQNAKSISKKLNIKVPFIDDLYSLIFEGKSIKAAIEDIK